LVVIAAVVLLAVWAGAQAAAVISSGQTLPVGLAETMSAAMRLVDHRGDPAAAWPSDLRPLLGHPVVYWLCTAVAFTAMTVALAATLHGTRPRIGIGRRVRLGVDTRARFATLTELAPVVVRRPTTGRFTLGSVHGRLVATEDRRGAPVGRRARARQGDRSAVIVIGPSRCGKTANTISGILEWDGPAVLSSVKTDLLAATIDARRTLGEVKVFDPTGATGQQSAHWSPLRAAKTAAGAQRAARALAEAGPSGGAENLPFFTALAQQLLWPVLFTAAGTGATMDDVVDWVLRNDRPTEDDLGQIAPRLLELAQMWDPDVVDDARRAQSAIEAVWGLDDRTRGGTYATCHTLLQAWQDPQVAATALRQDISLDWLLEGSNTLYLCGPMHEQARLSAVFGGLLGDLFQQAYQRAGRNNMPLPSTLIVLDEAGNTPARWLPQVASTCAGIGILLVTIWQSKAQIDHAYGQQADAVVTNHGSKVIFSGVSDRATLEYAGSLLGDEELWQRSITADAQFLGEGGRSVNHSATTAKLVPPDLLRRIAPGQALLIHGTLPPAHLHARPYYRLHRRRDSGGIGGEPANNGRASSQP
jgi:type IV secretion system protein VirD4